MADDDEVNGECLLVYALEEAGFDMADCVWREIMLAWVCFAGVTFLPVAINEIGMRIVADRLRVEERSITDAEQSIARWRALPVTFHFDQLNLCDFAQILAAVCNVHAYS